MSQTSSGGVHFSPRHGVFRFLANQCLYQFGLVTYGQVPQLSVAS